MNPTRINAGNCVKLMSNMCEAKVAEFQHLDSDLAIEYTILGAAASMSEPVLFLHEGLGSLAMWRDFPDRFCDHARLQGIVYSRPQYGESLVASTPAAWNVGFMHERAQEIAPFLGAIGHSNRRVWLFGHSDGASIALIFAALNPDRVAGLVLMAPHLFVESVTLSSIRATVDAFPDVIRPRLARYHRNVDRVFGLWSDAWLDPRFASWNIEAEVSRIRCPILAIQGAQDEYGTMDQIDSLKRHCPQAQLLKLPDCRHSPHRDHPDMVVKVATAFIRNVEAQAAILEG